MESRIHREVYVRFGEGTVQTCRSNADDAALSYSTSLQTSAWMQR
jgi:hypothetical protein